MCCARYFTDENNFICIQQQSKCYVQLRHMIQLLRTNCLSSKGVATNSTNPEPANPLKPVLSQNQTKEAWTGEVVFQEIDNYQFKGDLKAQKGRFSIDTNSIKYTVDNNVAFEFKLETINFNCESNTPCLVSDYLLQQDPYLEVGYDKDWQGRLLNSFWSAYPNINQKDCMVVVSDNTFFETSQMVLTCSSSPGQGDNMRRSVADIYNQKLGSLKGLATELDLIPNAPFNREYSALLISTVNTTNIHKVQAASTIIKIGLDGIIYKANSDYVFKYKDILDIEKETVLATYKLEDKEIPANLIAKKAKPSCCFKTWSKAGQLYYICLMTGDKCLYDKSSVYKLILTKGTRSISSHKAEMRRLEISKYQQVEDPFEFGLGPDYKTYSPKFNLDSLNQDTFDYSKNGIWQGWVYETALTERNYNKKVQPVWMEIGDGLIRFKTDEEEKIVYKTLKLVEYNQLCPNHCMPLEYIKSRIDTIDFDDMNHLKKAVENVLGQLKNAYSEEGCVLLDFMEPIYQFGHSHIICSLDKLQGEKIRGAIENSYYQALLDIDLDKQVKIPNLKNHRYFANIIINDQISNDFNQIHLDEYGIVGRKMPNDIRNEVPISNDVFNMTYAKIEGDNYGSQCAFWYKDLKIKQRNELTNKLIFDNNCCFKFYTKGDKQKIEICTYNQDKRVCIKNARELMKGIKRGCTNKERFAVKKTSSEEQQNDIYTFKTIDDSDNGRFEGFVFFGNLIEASQKPRANPYFVKIHKMSMEVYEDHTKTESPMISISIDTLKFSCKGRKPCSPNEYLLYIQANPELMSLSSTVQTIYNLFSDTYGLNKRLEKNCMVIETFKTPYILCPYVFETTPIIQKSLVQAFTLNYSCRRLASIPDPEATEHYKIVVQSDSEPVEDEVTVNLKGVVSTISDKLVLNFHFDNDPITNKKCAVWFKEIPVKFAFDYPECCFAVSYHGKTTTVCVKDEKLCISSSFKLMKSMWNGCMYNSPSQNKMLPSPDSEVLGETNYVQKIFFDTDHYRYSICTSKRDSVIFDETKVHNDYVVDIYNDIAYSIQKTLYKGWFNIYPIDVTTESKWDILKYYGELTPENFNFYDNPIKKTLQFKVRPDALSMSCGKGAACKPAKYLEYLRNYNNTLAYLNNTISSKIDLYELKHENGCSVLENFVANMPVYYIICPNIKKTRNFYDHLQNKLQEISYSEGRNLLSNHFGEIVRKIVYDSYLIARKFTKAENLNEGNNAPIKQIRMTRIMNTNEYDRVTIDKAGIKANSALLYKFDEIPNCRARVGLVYAPETVVYDKKPQCCMRFNGISSHEYVCMRELNCEYSVVKFAKTFVDSCKKIKTDRTQDDVFTELNAGDNIMFMNIIKKVFKTEIFYTDIKSLHPSEAISTEEFRTKQKTLAIKFLFSMKKIMHSIQVLEIDQSKKLVSTPHDTTPVDDPSPKVTSISARYIGENNEYTIISGQNRITQFRSKTDKTVVTITRGTHIIQAEDFSAIVSQKSEYVVLIYNDDGDKIIEISKNGVILTNTADKLSPEFKIVEPYLIPVGLKLPINENEANSNESCKKN